MRLFEIHQPINFTAAISLSFTRSSLLAHWNSGKYADAGYFAGKVDRGQIWVFSWLPLLWATNIDAEQEMEEKKGEESSPPPPPHPLPWAFIPGETQLTWVSQWWRVINKCIGLIIKDSLNEDRYYPLKAWWFHKPDLNSDVVVIPVCLPQWWSGDIYCKSSYLYYITLDNSPYLPILFRLCCPFIFQQMERYSQWSRQNHKQVCVQRKKNTSSTCNDASNKYSKLTLNAWQH